MPKKSDEDLTKHTLNLFAGDYAKLQSLFPDVGAGVVIRKVVRDFLSKIEGSTKPSKVKAEVKL